MLRAVAQDERLSRPGRLPELVEQRCGCCGRGLTIGAQVVGGNPADVSSNDRQENGRR
jgi:hypothetical protein